MGRSKRKFCQDTFNQELNRLKNSIIYFPSKIAFNTNRFLMIFLNQF